MRRPKTIAFLHWLEFKTSKATYFFSLYMMTKITSTTLSIGWKHSHPYYIYTAQSFILNIIQWTQTHTLSLSLSRQARKLLFMYSIFYLFIIIHKDSSVNSFIKFTPLSTGLFIALLEMVYAEVCRYIVQLIPHHLPHLAITINSSSQKCKGEHLYDSFTKNDLQNKS